MQGWQRLGWEENKQARGGVQTDDFVILCRWKSAVARERTQILMAKLKLTVNEQNTRTAEYPKKVSTLWDTPSARVTRPRTDMPSSAPVPPPSG